MKNASMTCALALLVFSSCQKMSTEPSATDTEKTTVTAPAPTSTPTSSDEPFSAKFTYSVPDRNNIFENQLIRFDCNVPGVQQYVWKFDNNAKSTEKSPVMSFPLHGYHTVTLEVTDRSGNTATASQQISILCNFGGSH